MKHPASFGFAYVLCFMFMAGAAVSALAADDALTWPALTSQTRPWTYWWWMGSAVDKTNITRELQRYHDAGLGGVHIIPIYGAREWEDKYINYLSPQWMEMMGWSVAEAKRLGMGVDMTTGTGWCFGGPQVSDQDANASVVVKTYDLGVGERLKEKFKRESVQALIAFGPDGKSIDLTDSISTNGEVLFSPAGNWTGTNATPPRTWTIYAISQKPSGQKVKRAAPGGEGWMLNPIYPQAMDDYLNRFTDAFTNYHGPKPRAQYQDSYEYKSDWSPDFFAQFEKRRGYKLQNELPALFGGGDASSPKSATGASQPPADHAARVLCDYRQTVSEIMAGESLPRWVKWSHDHGFITREEAHGSPGNLLDLYAVADIPETEFFSKKRNILVSKFASSAAHVAGKQLVSSESCTWMSEHFTETLGEIKGVMDEFFLSGINHAFYHGCCYSPDEAGWPGWHFYAATEMNPRNSIWRDAPAINDYIARVQSVLQSGQPDNDILLYWPICDYWSSTNATVRAPQFQVEAASQQIWFENQPIGKTAKELWDKGYSFDYVSDAQLLKAKVLDGKIQMPGGKYQVIVVPECKFIPLETFKQLLVLAENGAAVIFVNQLPHDMAISGLSDLESRKAQFQRLAKLPFNQLNHFYGFGVFAAWSESEVGKGRLLSSSSVQSTLFGAKASREKLTDAGLSFVRRSFEGGWNYFIANRSGTNFDGWIALARPAKSVAILDPMTGNAGAAATRQAATRQRSETPFEIHLQLATGESVILRAFDHVLPQDKILKAWNYWQTNGQPVEITGQWNVKFLLGGPTLPADFQTAKLASWTTFPDTNVQAFAGTAKYTLEFNLQVATDTLKRELQLNLGDVRQSARVRLNGKD